VFRRSLNNVEAERDETLRMIAALEKHREAAPLARKAQYRTLRTSGRARLRNESASLRKG